MTVTITPEHNAARLAATLAFLDAGPQAARLRIYTGPRPASPSDDPTGTMLVEIALTKPAGTFSGGVLALTQQADGLIVASGTATWARVVNGDGATAFDMDCSDGAGTGDCRLASTALFAGGDAKLVSANLS